MTRYLLIAGLFGKVDAERLERWLFVGITRATQWIYFSAVNNQDVLFIDRFKTLESQGQLTIKLRKDLLSKEVQAPTGQHSPSADMEDDDEDLADIF